MDVPRKKGFVFELHCDQCRSEIKPGQHVIVEAKGRVKLMVRDFSQDAMLFDSFVQELRYPKVQCLSLCEGCAATTQTGGND
jgi:hypothetical protein